MLALAYLLVASGCATYSDRMLAVRESAADANWEEGIDGVDKLIGVGGPDEMPDEWKSDTALGLLERGTLHQAIGNYSSSARDFEAADKQLEFLDSTNDTAGQVGKYVYRGSATKYRSAATERLALNSFNMRTYLARRDLRGARVEAKRFTVMRRYLDEFDSSRSHGTIGSYLAGFTLEHLGETNDALRYYDEALAERPLESLRNPITRLSSLASYRGDHIDAFLAAGKKSHTANLASTAELLILLNLGRVPYKAPERKPLGAAIGLAGTYITGNPEILGYTATKFVVYPKLIDSGSVLQQARLQLDDRNVSLELVSDLGVEIQHEYEALEPRIFGAAISRMIVRAAAAEGARAAVKQASKKNGELLGFLAAIVTEGALTALDKPDTRSWQLLPERTYIYRSRVRAGRHTIRVDFAGAGVPYRTEVDVPEGSWSAVVVTAPR